MNAYFNENNLSDFGIFQKRVTGLFLTPNNDHKNALPFENDYSLLSFGESI